MHEGIESNNAKAMNEEKGSSISPEVATVADIGENDLLILKLEGDSIILSPARRPLVSREKWAETTLEEFETESKEQTSGLVPDTIRLLSLRKIRE